MKFARNSDPCHDFIEKVEQTISLFTMVQNHDSVLVGLSGGPDSTALLCVLHRIFKKMPRVRLGAAHLNHGLRGEEAERDANFAAALASRMDIPYYYHKSDVTDFKLKHRLSIEEAARILRYRFFKRVALKNNFTKIALGHHRDDNAELILMNLFRGSGALGISGIPPVRDAVIIRPLIQTNRSEIIKFLDIKGITWVKDASNDDRKFLRNKIRLDLIPLLKKSYNPEIIDSLNRMASVLRCEEDWIESIITQMYNQCLISENILCENSQSIVFSVQKFCMMHIAAKRRILRKAILQIKGDLKRIQLSHIDDAIDLSDRQESAAVKGIDLPDGIRVELNHFHLIVLKKINDKKSADSTTTAEKISITDAPVFTYRIKKPGTLFITEINALLKISLYPRHCLPNFPDAKNFAGIKNTEAYFDMDLISFPVIIRTPVAGDRFIPLGITGVQKLKKFFIDHKVPKSERKLCPVLVSENSILWVAGHRMADPFKISPSTETVLKAELLLA